MYSDLHRQRAHPFHQSPAVMSRYNCSREKPTLVLRNTKELQDALAKHFCQGKSQLHLVIEECKHDEEEDLLGLYNLSKLFHLGAASLENLTISYFAQNEDDSQNPVRLMILVNLMNQLDWDTCKLVDINLNINYLQDDLRLQLIEDLPVIVRIHGKMVVSQNLADQSKLDAVTDSYSYLKDCI